MASACIHAGGAWVLAILRVGSFSGDEVNFDLALTLWAVQKAVRKLPELLKKINNMPC